MAFILALYAVTTNMAKIKQPPNITKYCSNGLGHMTNMSPMPLYGKSLKNLKNKPCLRQNLEVLIYKLKIKKLKIIYPTIFMKLVILEFS